MNARADDSNDEVKIAASPKSFFGGKIPSSWLWMASAFILALSVFLILCSSFLQRRMIISQVQAQFDYVVSAFNDAGLDIAYDDLSVSRIYPFKLLKATNFKIYSIHQGNDFEWKLPELSISSGLLDRSTLTLNFPQFQELRYDGQDYKINLQANNITIEISKDGLNNLEVELRNILVSDLAEIGEISFASRVVAPQQISDTGPFLQNYLEVKDVKLNGLLNYPLSQNIYRLYVNATVMGKINKTDTLQSSLHEWLARGGKIDIRSLTLNWPPLLLVGKGELYFNAKMKPIMRINTTSKALLVLINELDKKSWLDSKGAFVAKILLSNKAFKASPEDEQLTVSTPIAIQEDGLLIEKISVKKFGTLRK